MWYISKHFRLAATCSPFIRFTRGTSGGKTILKHGTNKQAGTLLVIVCVVEITAYSLVTELVKFPRQCMRNVISLSYRKAFWEKESFLMCVRYRFVTYLPEHGALRQPLCKNVRFESADSTARAVSATLNWLRRSNANLGNRGIIQANRRTEKYFLWHSKRTSSSFPHNFQQCRWISLD